MPAVLSDVLCESCGDRHTLCLPAGLHLPDATYAYACPETGEEVRHRSRRWATLVPTPPPDSVLIRLVE